MPLIHLEKKDIVLGPAFDGGYYLTGMKRNHNLFLNMNWSTDTVNKNVKNNKK